ncbi:MAG: hypothetical protein K6G30_04515 [Acetatifactor sp.]|nr:hypothetical protein [Acetatifactor sp.]
MTDQNFSYAKRVLDGILRENPDDTGAIKRYAKIFLSKSNTDMLSAGKMLEKAESLLEEAHFTGENKYIKDILLGDVTMAKGNPAGAKEIWNGIPKDDC